MPRFLTAEWVAAFNAALDGVELPAPGPDAGLTAADGRYTVAEEVRGAPDGAVRLLLRAADGSLTLALDDPGAAADADVTIGLDYADALTAGRIRVRGDLSVLATCQELLVAAREHTRVLDADTTY